jgi:hypothetical protein
MGCATFWALYAVADPHGAKGVQWILGKTNFLCILIEFHHMCTLEIMIFIYSGIIWLHGRLCSSSAAGCMAFLLVNTHAALPLGSSFFVTQPIDQKF